jgi:branched-chain amino acid transport system substrate-binding protein
VRAWRFASKVFVVGLFAATIGFAWADSKSCPTQCESGKVRLGITAPISGFYADFGRQTVKAAEIVVRELNAAGGLIGTPVELVVDDDRCDVEFVVSAATKHVEQDKVDFVIGPTCPPAAMAAAPIYAKANVIQFMPTMTTGITWQNPGIYFRIAETDEQSAHALGSRLAHEYRGKKVVVVYSDAFYMRPLIEMVWAQLPSDMQKLTRFATLLDVSGAAERLVDSLRRDPPDLVYMALDPELIVPLVNLLRKRGLKATLMAGQRLLSYRFWRVKEVEGIQVIAPLGTLDDPEFRKSVNLLEQAEVIPDIVALNTYSAVQTWAEAVRRAGDGDRKKVVDALQSGEFSTAVGRVAFDLRGDRRNISSTIVMWQDGKLRELGTHR